MKTVKNKTKIHLRHLDTQTLAVGDEKIGNIASQHIHIIESGPIDKNGFPIFDTTECFAKYQTQYQKSQNVNSDDQDSESLNSTTFDWTHDLCYQLPTPYYQSAQNNKANNKTDHDNEWEKHFTAKLINAGGETKLKTTATQEDNAGNDLTMALLSIVNQYGSKQGQLIIRVQELLSNNNNNNIIIFSVYHDKLKLIRKRLELFDIKSVFLIENQASGVDIDEQECDELDKSISGSRVIL